MPYRVYMLVHPKITTINHAFASFLFKITINQKKKKKNSRTPFFPNPFLPPNPFIKSQHNTKEHSRKERRTITRLSLFPGHKMTTKQCTLVLETWKDDVVWLRSVARVPLSLPPPMMKKRNR